MTRPEEAYEYALNYGGSDKLRSICCQYPWYAYRYAIRMDKGYHEETRRACYKYHDYYTLYLKNILKSKYYEELNLLPDLRRLNNDLFKRSL